MNTGPTLRVTLRDVDRPIALFRGRDAFTIQNLGPGLVRVSLSYAQGTQDDAGFVLLAQGVLIVAVEADYDREVSVETDTAGTVIIQSAWKGAAGFIAVRNPTLAVTVSGTVAVSADASALALYDVLELYARVEEQTNALTPARAWRLEADRRAIVRLNGAADVLVVGRESIPVYDLTLSSISYRAAGPLEEGTLRIFGRR